MGNLVSFIAALRLVYGSSNREGKVEMFVDGEWRRVVQIVSMGGAYPFSKDEAKVVCRQLGYPTEWVFTACLAPYR